MLAALPPKFDAFTGQSIDLNYLDEDYERDGWERDMLAKELMLPCPEWAQKEALDKTMDQQEEGIAGSFPTAKTFINNNLLVGGKEKLVLMINNV